MFLQDFSFLINDTQLTVGRCSQLDDVFHPQQSRARRSVLDQCCRNMIIFILTSLRTWTEYSENESSGKVSEYSLNQSKQNFSVLVRALTGHCTLNYHMAPIRLAERTAWDSCDARCETLSRWNCSCLVFAQLRFRIFGYHVSFISINQIQKMSYPLLPNVVKHIRDNFCIPSDE